MDVIILLGAPGSGKGTTSVRLIDRIGSCHLSTGDMLRASVAQGTVTGLQAARYMERGELVPDVIITAMVAERLSQGDADQYLLDGFPRTTRQAEMLVETLAAQGGTLKLAITLDVPRDVLIRRLSGRMVCSGCGAGYHEVTLKPKRDGVCDRCGRELVQRKDDDASTVMRRLEIYEERTAPLIAWYDQRGLLKRTNGDRSPEAVVSTLVDLIEEGH